MTVSAILTSDERLALSALRLRLEHLLGSRLERMVLFGSKARGDAGPDSDTDVAIIVEGLDRNLRRRIFDVIAEIELEYVTALSTLVMSTADLKRLKARELRLAEDIEREGVTI